MGKILVNVPKNDLTWEMPHSLSEYYFLRSLRQQDNLLSQVWNEKNMHQNY